MNRITGTWRGAACEIEPPATTIPPEEVYAIVRRQAMRLAPEYRKRLEGELRQRAMEEEHRNV